MPEMEACIGYVNTRVPSAVIDYAGQGTLAFAAGGVGEGDTTVDLTMAIHTPDGTWRCSDDFDGVNPAIGIEAAAAGRYAVWVGTFGQDVASPSTVLTVSETMPVAPDPMFDDGDMAAQPYSEGTYMVLRPDARPSVRLTVGPDAASGTTTVTPEGMNPVAGASCGGYIAAAPTASVEMRGDGPFGITATAEDGSDLVLVIHAPDDTWTCSDDANALDPGVQFGSADAMQVPQGTYHVWVGTFGDPNGMEGMDMDGTDTGMAQPMGPTTVTVTAARGEITISQGDMGDMGDMMDRPDYSEGMYDGSDLQSDRPMQTLALRDNAAEADVTAGGTLINPVDGDACAGFVDARPTLAVTAGDAPLAVTAAADGEDLVMLARTPSGSWMCSDDAGGSQPAHPDERGGPLQHLGRDVLAAGHAGFGARDRHAGSRPVLRRRRGVPFPPDSAAGMEWNGTVPPACATWAGGTAFARLLPHPPSSPRCSAPSLSALTGVAALAAVLAGTQAQPQRQAAPQFGTLAAGDARRRSPSRPAGRTATRFRARAARASSATRLPQRR